MSRCEWRVRSVVPGVGWRQGRRTGVDHYRVGGEEGE